MFSVITPKDELRFSLPAIISFLKLVIYLFLPASPRERMEVDVIMSPARMSLRLAPGNVAPVDLVVMATR